MDLDVLFTFNTTSNSLLLVFLYGGQPYGEEDNVKKKKKKGMDDTYFDEWSPHEQDF